MAEIRAFGISHYPGLATPDEKMAGLLRQMLKNPNLPEKLRHVENWPEPMRREWGSDEGLSAARHHREALVNGFNKVRQALDDYKPDFVVIFGDDQYENFREDIIPPYCILAYDQIEARPPAGNVWNEPVDQVFHYQGNRQAAKYLATNLLEEGFDAAYSYKPLHHTLGHAFRNAMMYLDYDRTKSWQHPVVPFAINCYGRHVVSQQGGAPDFDNPTREVQLDPPGPLPRRMFDIGAATAKIFAKSPWRVALMASSSWSHAFLTAKNYYLYPDTPADEALYAALLSGNYAAWRERTLAEVENSGQQEILNWMALVGAVSELKLKTAYNDFVTTTLFNSSKCFYVAKQA
jgi:hypothetical protein